MFGFGDPEHILIEDLVLDRKALFIGESLRFTFKMNLEHNEAYRIRLEYKVSYTKANGKLAGKIFQIREASYQPGLHNISRKHNFKDLSTRKHYPGEHMISIIVNGIEKRSINFKLLAPSKTDH